MNKDHSSIPIWVFKLGGSLLRSDALRDWLDLLATNGAGRIVIVPGGGAFADSVREHQRASGIDDASAHRMALLAMAQSGYALCAMQPRLRVAASVEAVRAALGAHQVPVWLPLDLLEPVDGIEESWRMTSDSLAAWLAGRLGAARLILVKAASIPAQAKLEALARAGLVDELFPSYARQCNCVLRIVNEAEIDAVRELFAVG